MAITNFNRLINIKFLNNNGVENRALRITTPVKGRKPNITINGLYLPNDSNTTFEVEVKNLYMNLTQRDYPNILVEAGYENQMRIAFFGTIIYAYRDSPGPESSVVFHCMYKLNVLNWAITPIKMSYRNGMTLREALKNISSALRYSEPLLSPQTQTMSSKEKFLHVGTAEEAIKKLRLLFNINILVDGNRIRAYTNAENKPVGQHYLNFLSSPPQITGGGQQAATATINAPWVPGIRPGDFVTFNTKFYTTNMYFNLTKEQVTIQVNTIQLNFSTVAKKNQMTLMGTVR